MNVCPQSCTSARSRAEACTRNSRASAYRSSLLFEVRLSRLEQRRCERHVRSDSRDGCAWAASSSCRASAKPPWHAAERPASRTPRSRRAPRTRRPGGASRTRCRRVSRTCASGCIRAGGRAASRRDEGSSQFGKQVSRWSHRRSRRARARCVERLPSCAAGAFGYRAGRHGSCLRASPQLRRQSVAIRMSVGR